jgi:hypothetical protein
LKKKIRTDELLDPFLVGRELSKDQKAFKVKTDIDYA